jgi:mRNA-degrading endonuclease RelE of RelBE toxin-antitoxin system
MIFDELPEYQKDIKRLNKKYPTIEADINILKLILDKKPDENPPKSFRINNLRVQANIIKYKHITSKSFKGKGANSGFRLIYSYNKDEEKITLIEIYHKSEKENEDRDRIFKYFQ